MEGAHMTDADHEAAARAWPMLSKSAIAKVFAEVRAEGFAAGVAQERERCRELVSEAARMCEEAGDLKVVGTLQVVSLAIVTSGAVRDAAAIRAGEVRG